MKILDSRKFLARNLIDARRMQQLRLVDMTGERVAVSAFDMETHSTIFVDSTVILLKREAADNLEKVLSPSFSSRKIPEITDILLAADLLAYPGMPSSEVIAVDLFA